MKKIVFTLVFCVACLTAGVAQTVASSANTDAANPPSADPVQFTDSAAMQYDPNPRYFRPEDIDASFYYFMHKSTIPLPEEITNLIVVDADAAVAKLEAYKKTLKTKDPLQLLLLDAEFYDMLRDHEKFKKNYQVLLQKMKSEYGDRAEVIRFEIDDFGVAGNYTPEKVIEIADRMIKADAKYLPAYFIRGQEYLRLGETDKFCEDFNKLPETVRLNDANYKRTCKK